MQTAAAVKDDVSQAASLDELYDHVTRMDLTPGWVPRKIPILWKEPKSDYVPMHWRYEGCKAALDAAGRLIDVALAERRNLLIRNPIPGNNFSTTRTLVSAYQMILPGEKAPSHRHAPHAMRFIIDAKGAYSVVNGERTPMETGDVVLTPSWCWHGHGHDGSAPAYWLDCLDVPLTHLLEPMFVEDHPDGFEKVTRVVQESPFRFARASIERALDNAKPTNDGAHDRRIQLDAAVMGSIGIYIHRLHAGFKGRAQRITAGRIFCVGSGTGTSTVGDRQYSWSRGDTIIAPGWVPVSHSATSDASLIELSDEPLMHFTKFYRSQTE
jgi:gentisate 1,2-dioxygenase